MTMQQMKWIDRCVGLVLCGVVAFFDALARWVALSSSAPVIGCERVRKILITKYLGMGSLVLATPMVGAVRRRYPQAKILFLTSEANREICRLLEIADEVLTIRTTGFLAFARDLFTVLRRLRRGRIDLAFDLEFLSKFSALVVYFSGARERVGYTFDGMWRARLLTRPVPYEPHQHITRVFSSLVEPPSCEGVGPLPVSLLRVSGESMRFVDELLRRRSVWQNQEIVCVNVNTGEMCLERRWHGDRFAELIREILRQGLAKVVLIGAPSERPYVESLAALVGPSSDLLNLAGEVTVEQLLALLKRSRLLITNDAGPLHLAAACGTPTIALFGPETPLLYGPVGEGHIVFYKQVHCSPCLTVANNKTPPCHGNNICMSAISVEEVLAAVERILGRSLHPLCTVSYPSTSP
ncbi:MAG: glycosyltransferase family 9 protein [candidate division NC10 bacterium]|nr:glycosyltransferase family 9 protein [candidate division NC10 bacterium]